MKAKFNLILTVFLISFYFNTRASAQVNEQDSLALVEIYQAYAPTFNFFWGELMTPISQWAFITVDNNRVTGIDIEFSPSGGTLSGDFPESLNDLTELIVFRIIEQNVTSIPNIDNLTKLEVFNIYKNNVPLLPDFSNSPELRILNCSFNNLESLPELNQLTNLEILNCFSNNITSLPDVNSLTNLEFLNCSVNSIENLPSLSNLINLTTLSCKNNLLSDLPDLSSLVNLTLLSCVDNFIKDLPGLADLDSLENIFCFLNYLTFEDIIPVYLSNPDFEVIPGESGPPYFIFSPQKKRSIKELYSEIGVTDYEINLYPELFPQDSNLYIWKKGVDTIFMGFIEKDYIIPQVTLNAAGLYTLEVTNPTLPSVAGPSTFAINDTVYLNVIQGNSVNGDSVAGQFIIQYNEDVTGEQIDNLEDYLRDSLDLVKIKECMCLRDSFPGLQLWRSRDSIILDTGPIRQIVKTSVGVDTLHANFIVNLDLIVESSDPHTYCITEFTPGRAPEADVNTAIIDSGIGHHNDLNRLIRIDSTESYPLPKADNNMNCFCNDVRGYDFVSSSYAVNDTLLGHGKLVAGIVGFGDGVKLMDLKIYDQNVGFLFDVVCGIHYAINNGAQVINLSLGYFADEPSPLLYDALLRAKRNGVIVVVSSGNEGEDLEGVNIGNKKRWPASFGSDTTLNNLIVVAALDYSGEELASFSNYGASPVHVAALGTSIRTTFLDNDYATVNGTSLSAAFVTRLVSELWSQESLSSYSDIIDCIKNNVKPIKDGSKLAWGGKIDPASAFECMGIFPTQKTYETIKVFPNPFSDNIRFEIGANVASNYTISIYNMLGHKVFQTQCTSSAMEWDGRKNNGDLLSPGMYTVKIEGDGEEWSTKVIKSF